MTGNAPVHGSAEFSADGTRRHRLDRWHSEGPRFLVCMANPSKAGATENDPTIGRVNDLLLWRSPGYTVVNADDYIATDPKDLARWLVSAGHERVRTERAENLARIRRISETAALRIVAWGNLAPNPFHAQAVIDAMSCGGRFTLYAFGFTQDMRPKHPMARGHHRIPNTADLLSWVPASVESVAA